MANGVPLCQPDVPENSQPRPRIRAGSMRNRAANSSSAARVRRQLIVVEEDDTVGFIGCGQTIYTF